MNRTKRIGLSITTDLDETLTALAELQNCPKTQIITKVLEDLHPVLKQLQAGLEQVRDNKSPEAMISALFASMTEQYAEVATEYASDRSGATKND